MANELLIPMQSLSKREIEEQVGVWLNDALEHYEADELYVMLKQMEHAVKNAIETTKEVAFNRIGDVFRGQSTGYVLGHDVKLTYPTEWTYSEKVAELKERQKAELKALELQEQANGTAKKMQKPGQITVTLRKEAK